MVKQIESYKKKLEKKPKKSAKDFMKIEVRIRQLKDRLLKEEQENNTLKGILKEYKSENELLSRTLNEKFEDSDMSKILYNLTKFKSENFELQKEKNYRELKLSQLDKQVSEQRQQLEEFDNLYRKEVEKNEELVDENENHTEEIQQLRSEIQILINKMEETKEQIDKCAEIEKRCMKLGEIVPLYETLQTEHEEMKTKYEQLLSISEHNENKLNEIYEKLSVEIEETKQAKIGHHEAEERLEQYSKQLERFAIMNQEYIDQKKAAEKKCKMVIQRMRRMKTRESHRDSRIAAFEKGESERISKLQEELEDRNVRDEERRKEIDSLKDELSKMRIKNMELQNKMQFLDREKQNEEKEREKIEKSKGVLQKTLGGHLKEQREKYQISENGRKKLKMELTRVQSEFGKLEILYNAKVRRSFLVSGNVNRSNAVHTSEMKSVPEKATTAQDYRQEAEQLRRDRMRVLEESRSEIQDFVKRFGASRIKRKPYQFDNRRKRNVLLDEEEEEEESQSDKKKGTRLNKRKNPYLLEENELEKHKFSVAGKKGRSEQNVIFDQHGNLLPTGGQ